jgi:hypothetical protein
MQVLIEKIKRCNRIYRASQCECYGHAHNYSNRAETTLSRSLIITQVNIREKAQFRHCTFCQYLQSYHLCLHTVESTIFLHIFLHNPVYLLSFRQTLELTISMTISCLIAQLLTKISRTCSFKGDLSFSRERRCVK